ncbi:MAG: metallophosphoesterase [Pirellulales bacterium]
MNEISLVQISDLHFDSHIWNAEPARLSSLVGSGYDAHDVRLCAALKSVLVDELRVPNLQHCHLLVGGDLTATGAAAEFATATQYLKSAHRLEEDGIAFDLGLSQPAARCWTVPGNHDHWNGRWMYARQPGYTAEVFPTHFPVHPWAHSIVSGTLELVLFGIDSNTIFEDFWINISLGAMGGFSARDRKEIAALIQETMSAPLRQGIKRRVAALLCHHPFSSDCRAAPLRLPCSKWLLELAADCNVPVVLTGHTHRWWTQSFPVKTPRQEATKWVFEVRSPTTLQTEPKLRPEEPRDPALRRPGFWLHRIRLEPDGRVRWTAQLYLYSAGQFYWNREANWFSFNH